MSVGNTQTEFSRVKDVLLVYGSSSDSMLIKNDLTLVRKSDYGIFAAIWDWLFGPGIDKYETASKIKAYVEQHPISFQISVNKEKILEALEKFKSKFPAQTNSSIESAIRTIQKSPPGRRAPDGLDSNPAVQAPANRSPAAATPAPARTWKKVVVPQAKDTRSKALRTAEEKIAELEAQEKAARAKADPFAAQVSLAAQAEQLQRGVVAAIHDLEKGQTGKTTTRTVTDETKYARNNNQSQAQRAARGVASTTAVRTNPNNPFETPSFVDASKKETTTTQTTTGKIKSKLEAAKARLKRNGPPPPSTPPVVVSG